jgi:cAMP phosphodiesterase
MKIKTLLLFVLYTSCFYAQNDSICLDLKVSEIASVKMKLVNPKNATLSRELVLTSKNIIAFVNQWNSLRTDSAAPIKPKYFLFVTLKNKNVRYFAVGGNQTDDSKCRRTSPDNALFFDKLWDEMRE